MKLIKNRRDFPSSPAVKTPPTLPWPRAQVQPLVRELRFHKLCGVAKKEKKRKQQG